MMVMMTISIDGGGVDDDLTDDDYNGDVTMVL